MHMADKGGLVPRGSSRTRVARSTARTTRRRRSTARRFRAGGKAPFAHTRGYGERARGALGSLTFPTRKMAEPKTTPRARKVTRRRRHVIAAYPQLAGSPCGTARFFRLLATRASAQSSASSVASAANNRRSVSEIENDGRVHCGHYGGESGRCHG